MGAKETKREVDFSTLNLVRLGHNFLMEKKGGNYTPEELNTFNDYVNFLLTKDHPQKSYKVGVVFVCINEPYWQYAEPVIQNTKEYFLPGHDVEIMMWSDMHRYPEARGVDYGITVFPTESMQWPYPTLMRYHLFLQQEEYFKKFDYLFYIDLDMRIVNVVGDEILGDGLTAAQHPMYATKKELWPPYEPNPQSEAYIKRPGDLVDEGGKQRFRPLYFAGGVQGGRTRDFIKAMKEMKRMIDSDLSRNYIPIWNDESVWNKYLFDNPPAITLSPSYVYPDSMIQEYYLKVWGKDYPPKIITLTKPFSTSKEGGAAAAEMVKNM